MTYPTVDGKRTTVLHTSDPKTARSRRTVDLDAGTVAVLRAHRRTMLGERMVMGGGFTDRGLVFTMPDGSPWNPDTISQAFDRLVASSGLPRVRLHDLRHGHATHLLAAGVAPGSSQSASGTPRWRSPSTPTATSSRASRPTPRQRWRLW